MGYDFSAIELEQIHEALCYAVANWEAFEQFMIERGTATTVRVTWIEGGVKDLIGDGTYGGHQLIGKVTRLARTTDSGFKP